MAELLWLFLGDLRTAHSLARVALRRGRASDMLVLICAAAGDVSHMRAALAIIARVGQHDPGRDGQTRPGTLLEAQRGAMWHSRDLATHLADARLHLGQWPRRAIPPAHRVSRLLLAPGVIEHVGNVTRRARCLECGCNTRQLDRCAGCSLRALFCSRRCQKLSWRSGKHHCV